MARPPDHGCTERQSSPLYCRTEGRAFRRGVKLFDQQKTGSCGGEDNFIINFPGIVFFRDIEKTDTFIHSAIKAPGNVHPFRLIIVDR